MGHHKALQTYLTALLNVTHDPMEACADLEFKEPVPRSIFGRVQASMDVVLAYSDSNPREVSTELDTTRYIPPNRPPAMDGWRGVGFEFKTSSPLEGGLTMPFKAAQQLFDYRSAGYVPVLVAPRKNLDAEREGIALKKSVLHEQRNRFD